VVKLLTNEYNFDLEDYKTVLEWIIEDEKRHIQILAIIKSRIAEQKAA
jgi:rubrerythrin